MKQYYSIRELQLADWFPYKSYQTIKSLVKSGKLEQVEFSSRTKPITAESVNKFLNPQS